MQRMLPAPATNGSSNGLNGGFPTPPLRRADRSFQYRFSLNYVRGLPEAQRPVERDIFGESGSTLQLRRSMSNLYYVGPFTVQQLQQWRGTGFFGGPACENVELRKAPEAGEEATAWGAWSTVVGV